MAVEVFGQHVFLAGSRSEKGELMIVATNQNPKNAIPIYLRRWEIECLFSTLKGRRFRFEETHMTTLERVEKLMVVLAIGFCWAHKVGEWKAAKKQLKSNDIGIVAALRIVSFVMALISSESFLSIHVKKLSHFKNTLTFMFDFYTEPGMTS